MDNSSSVEVAHCLGNLTTNVDTPFQSKGLTPDVGVGVECTTFAKAVSWENEEKY